MYILITFLGYLVQPLEYLEWISNNDSSEDIRITAGATLTALSLDGKQVTAQTMSGELNQQENYEPNLSFKFSIEGYRINKSIFSGIRAFPELDGDVIFKITEPKNPCLSSNPYKHPAASSFWTVKGESITAIPADKKDASSLYPKWIIPEPD